MPLLQGGFLRLRDAVRLTNGIPALRMTIHHIAGESATTVWFDALPLRHITRAMAGFEPAICGL
jgi:hypothetical protein